LQGDGRRKLEAGFLVATSFLLALFPILRPFGDESAVLSDNAQAYASTLWVLSHSLAGLGFVLLPLGLLGLYEHLKDTGAEKRAFKGLVFGILGAGGILPVIGVEAFALNAVGQAAVQQNNLDLLGLVDSIRFGPDFAFLLGGLILLAIGGILFASAVWASGTLPKWAGVLFGVGLALFFPLFPQPIRVIDGLMIGLGGIWIGAVMLRSRAKAPT
jgi:hypothetical protein